MFFQFTLTTGGWNHKQTTGSMEKNKFWEKLWIVAKRKVKWNCMSMEKVKTRSVMESRAVSWWAYDVRLNYHSFIHEFLILLIQKKSRHWEEFYRLADFRDSAKIEFRFAYARKTLRRHVTLTEKHQLAIGCTLCIQVSEVERTVGTIFHWYKIVSLSLKIM